MKKLLNPTFRTSLIILLISIVIISTSFFFLIYYNLSDNPLRNIIKDNLGNMSKGNAQFIEFWLNENLSIIDSLAQSPSILNGKPEEMRESISSASKVHTNFHEIAFLTPEGYMEYNSLGSKSIYLGDREYFTAAKNLKTYISDKIISRTINQPIIILSAPVIKNGSFTGAVIGEIKLDQISNLITSKNFNNVNQSYIFDKDGNLISTINPQLNSQIYKGYIKQVLSSDKHTLVAEYTNSFGTRVLGSCIVLPHRDWILISEIDISKNLTTVKQSSIKAGIFTLILITILLIPSILYLTRKLTNPLKSISQLASELSMGNFVNRITYKSNNEIGILAKSFNTMADNLQDTYEELNKKISDLNIQKEDINSKNIKLEQVIQVNRTILDQLEENNRQLEKANKVKAEFLATMSHELRTPLNSIIGYTEMILDGNDGKINKEQQKDLEIILKSSENLLNMINDVLDLSKIEAGKMTYKFKYFNVINEVSNMIENVRGMSQSKDLDLIFEHDENMPEIFSDPVKFNHIVSNLLSNAIKFTDSGSIKVLLQKEDNEFIKISVIDTGVGIPANDINSIFDEFKQLDGSSTRKYGGTGLGLTIVKALVEGLGGNISVTSQVGVGSTFTAKIPMSNSSIIIDNTPVKNTQEHAKDFVAAAIQEVQERQENILIITMNTINFNNVSEALSDYNFITSMSNFDNALETAKTIKPSCIFIDIDVPCSNCNDGWLTLTDLRQDRETTNIPIIIISSQNDHCLSYSLGATSYLIKPFTKQDLVKCLNACFIRAPRGYVLLIDDDKDNFNLMSKVIRRITNYSTLMASEDKDIKNVLNSSNQPNIIIINATLPYNSIFEIIKLINSVDTDRKIPLIAIAGRNLNTLEYEFLKQYTKRILQKNDIRYSKLVSEIKLLMIENYMI